MNRAERERLFHELFAENQSRIQRLCYGFLGSSAEVDDLFQEIMVNVWNSLPGFRGESRPSTWLYRIAVNTALIGRYYERFADHAVAIARQVHYLTTGRVPQFVVVETAGAASRLS